MEARITHSASLEKEQETLWYFGGLRIIKALGERTNGSCKIFEYREPAGTYISSYAPYQEDTAFYIVEGEAIFSSGGTTIHATPGTFLFLPRNVSFRYQVTRSGSARILTWTTPMGFAHRVMSMGNPGQALVLPTPHIFERERMQQLTTLLRNTAQTIEKR
jgi:quercetin dioxygenase-like cupin family protein